MGSIKKKYPASFKAKVATEAIKEEKSSTEFASIYGAHPSMIRQWRKKAKEGLIEIFKNPNNTKDKEKDRLIEELYKQVGKLKVELDWLKKRLGLPHKERVVLIEKVNKKIPISRQAELLGISRSSIYYKPRTREEEIILMKLIDEQYTKTPFYGSRKMTKYLRRRGYIVNRKRVQRLMRVMEIEAIYPKPKLSKSNPEHKIYPYLLKGVI